MALSAEIYTVETLTEEEYRDWVDFTFRPVFERLNPMGTGVACREMLTRFQHQSHGLPHDRWNKLILYLDANRDGRITFEEFRSVLVKMRYSDLSVWKRFGLRALLAGNPGFRLHAAQQRAARHLQDIDAEGRRIASQPPGQLLPSNQTLASTALPNAITGRLGNSFILESDGVWPTAERPHRKDKPTIVHEVYIPQQYLEAYNCGPPPIFIPLMVLIQVAVFIYYAVELNQRGDAEPENVLTWTTGFPYFSPLYFDPRRRREVWRFLTYMLIHQGIWHMVFNAVVTLVLGCLVEWVHKAWRVGPVYLAGVLSGSLACSVLDPRAVLAGASGGTFALVGAHLALVIMNWEELRHDCSAADCRKPLSILASGATRLSLIVIFCCVDFGISLYQRFGLPDAHLNVSISAHVSGFVAGLLIGIPVLRNLHERPWEYVLFWASIGVAAALFIFAIFWNIFWPGYPAQLV